MGAAGPKPAESCTPEPGNMGGSKVRARAEEYWLGICCAACKPTLAGGEEVGSSNCMLKDGGRCDIGGGCRTWEC